MRGSAYLDSFRHQTPEVLEPRCSSRGSCPCAASNPRPQDEGRERGADRRPLGGSSAALGRSRRFRPTWGARAHGRGERDRDRAWPGCAAPGSCRGGRAGGGAPEFSRPPLGFPRAAPAQCGVFLPPTGPTRGPPVEVPSPRVGIAAGAEGCDSRRSARCPAGHVAGHGGCAATPDPVPR